MLRLVLGLTVLLACGSPAVADITAANGHTDRAAFERCGDAIDGMSESQDKFDAAVTACNKAAVYYSQEVTSAKDTDSRCRAELYAGSSMKRYAYVLSKSQNSRESPKAAKLGREYLNIVRIAKKINSI
jgi:hypothetical protein